MEEKLLATKEILKKYGQEHLLSNYEKLSNEDKNRLLNDILTIDLVKFQSYMNKQNIKLNSKIVK